MAAVEEGSSELEAARLDVAQEGAVLAVRLSGVWVTATVGPQDATLAAMGAGGATEAVLDLSAVKRLDTAGAWLVDRTRKQLAQQGLAVSLAGVGPAREALLQKIQQRQPCPEPPKRPGALITILTDLGKATVETGHTVREVIGFLGATVVVLLRSLARPKRLRGTSLVYHLEKTGLDALPIVGLLAFLIGVVLAYQGADQLARFGAEIFTVNLVGVAVLREMGVLITAIIVAGRSGSAFTAQIGTMKVNQEVDAMSTIGLDPLEVLVLPRVLALVIALPLLTFYANVMGLLGGAVMATVVLDIDLLAFARQLRDAVELSTFWVGMIKAPIFAFVIALIGCYEGLKVSSNAESVGLRTTRAVVEAIFLVILLDALFSVFYSVIGV
ncbi:ABC transporter permease [Algihabitans albus]|uniref:ABC transporter permease n=1 Tax=Algihabitans albus TaxID=2164067 RepID=UPI000E5CB3E6|nr:ABC transporter permease [Algihabitans albus]